MRVAALVLAASVSLPISLCAQVVPDMLYYRFNEGAGTTTANIALPGVGSPNATLTGGLGFGSGQYGTGLSGTGATSATAFVNTGYAANLNGMSWTIEFWWNPNAGTALQYLCGITGGSGNFRIFTGGSPGTNVVLSGTGLTTLILTGAVPSPGTWVHVAYVFNAGVTPATLTGYINGAFVGTNNQTGAPVLNNGAFVVGAAGTASGLNGFMDEFRLWGTARTATEIQTSYNTELFPNNLLSATTTGAGTGDLYLSLASVSPGATEGFTLISATTPTPVGQGPILGLTPDALTWSIFGYPSFPGNPFHFPVGIPGVFPDQPFVLPPGALSNLSGTTLDVAVLILGPGGFYLGRSSVARLAF